LPQKMGLTLPFTDAIVHVAGATFASESGAPDFHVKLQGQWKSDAYLCYLCVSLDQRWALPVLMSSFACSRVG
jgi:hypothetical protein